MGIKKIRRPLLAPGGQVGSGSYTTGEVDTGNTWHDGKAVFKKTFVLGALPASTGTNSVAHGITGLDTVISQVGTMTTGTTTRSIPFADNNATDSVLIETTATNVLVRVYANWADHDATITLLYTKS